MIVKEEVYNSIVAYVKKHLEVVEDKEVYYISKWPPYQQWLSEQVNSKKTRKKVEGISAEVEEAFQAFWAEYPGISRFEYMGKKFEGERVLKANKQVCLKLYNDAIEDLAKSGCEKGMLVGQSISRTLLKALQVQLETIKQESYKTGINKLQYLKSCEVYLRQRAYEPWLGQEMPEPLIKKQEPMYNSTDM